jgi:LacI family transcriptional regulator
MGRKARIRKAGQVTIVEVAALAGVSISTVSRVLNGSSYVDPEKKGRIDEAIRELGFAPKAAARALAGRRTKVLGLLVPEISDDFFVPMLRGIEGAARRAGYELLIKTTRYGDGARGNWALGEHNTDGVLLFADSADPEIVRALSSHRFPLVLLYTRPPAGLEIPSVTIDNESGAASAIAHLAEAHGRRRIVCLSGPEGNYDAGSRLRGYRAALEKLGLAFDPELVVPGDFSAEVAAASIAGLLGRGLPFDAVFACDDGAAMGVIAALGEAGLKAGEDVSVVGFDDLAFAALSSPPLATVWAPTEEIGAEGVRMLVALVDSVGPGPGGSGGPGRPGMVESRVFSTRYVPRRSCGCGEERSRA